MGTIGIRIRKLRELKNLSMDELGAKVGITRSQVSLYELDKSSPNVKMLEKIADALGVPVTDFFIEGESNQGFESNNSLQTKNKILQEELRKSRIEHEKTKETLIRVIQERLGIDKKD